MKLLAYQLTSFYIQEEKMEKNLRETYNGKLDARNTSRDRSLSVNEGQCRISFRGGVCVFEGSRRLYHTHVPRGGRTVVVADPDGTNVQNVHLPYYVK